MGTNPNPGPGTQGGSRGRFEEIWERVEAEVRQAAAYVNANVTPKVKKESVTAMRSVADALRNLADKIEKTEPKGPQV